MSIRPSPPRRRFSNACNRGGVSWLQAFHYLQVIHTLAWTRTNTTTSHHVPEVVFEDPAALCCGLEEVAEAFRALRACSPEHIEEPLLTDAALLCAAGEAPAGVVCLQLRQRYFGRLEVRSAVLVDTDESGRITRFEERWNMAPLVTGALFQWTRRLNGKLSFALTPRLLRTPC
ncbi:unnamed protein product [Prorocentrum cordatum]|uniref:SnoaL-like domain-containing protein n=1 Tax=Prorocentrum cordatum TaxID=2364126 RepID=A0ABN9URS1_9DINO|nr:unnamed protein product [Polarella glacialis]